MLLFFSAKKQPRDVAIEFSPLCIMLYVFYRQQKNAAMEREEDARIRALTVSKEPLSGVWVESRTPALPLPFILLWINHLLPYHVSFIITDQHGRKRHVGLGSITHEIPFSGSFPFAMTQWRLHEGPQYANTLPGRQIPIEAWGLFKRSFGNYPHKIDKEALCELTKTPEEHGVGHEKKGLQGYFISPTIMPAARHHFSLSRLSWHDCRSAALKVAHSASTPPFR